MQRQTLDFDAVVTHEEVPVAGWELKRTNILSSFAAISDLRSWVLSDHKLFARQDDLIWCTVFLIPSVSMRNPFEKMEKGRMQCTSTASLMQPLILPRGHNCREQRY